LPAHGRLRLWLTAEDSREEGRICFFSGLSWNFRNDSLPGGRTGERGRLAELATGQARAQLTPRDGQSPVGVAAALKAAGASSTATLLGTDGPSARHDVVVAYKVRATGSARAPDSTDYHVARVTLTRQRATWLVSTFAIEP